MNYENIKESTAKILSIDESIKTIKLPFRLVGLNLKARSRKFSENFIFWLNMIWMNSALFLCLNWMCKSLLAGVDFTDITFVAPGATLGIIGNFKGAYAFLHEDKVIALIDILRRLEKNVDKAKVTVEETRKIKLDIRLLNWVIKIFNILNVLLVLVYGLTPLVLITVKYYMTKELELMLPFLDTYPFDSLNLRYWPFTYIHQMGSEVTVLLQICSADFFFYICCTHIKIQFKLLQLEVTDIISEHEISEDSAKLRQNFGRLIKWHQEIIGAAGMLEIITSKATLSNFVVSSVIICLTGFNVSTTDDINAIVIFMTFLFMSLLQVFFLCFFGDMLMRSSIEVSDAVYNCKWYLTDVSTRKTVLLIQARAQTPCKVTAAGFADINLRAYMGILSTSWSYFALLKTLYGSSRT